MDKFCLNCGVKIRITNKFCGSKCYHDYTKTNKVGRKLYKQICKYCNKEFILTSRQHNNKYPRKFCSRNCGVKSKVGKKNWWGYKISQKLKNKPKSKEHSKKVGLKLKGVKRPEWSGENHWNWKGGENSIKEKIRKSFENKTWKIKCLNRDKVCVKCGEKKSKLLEVDHIIPLSFIIKKFNINSLEESLNCTELWDIKNGRVLCKNCHKMTNTYGEKALKYSASNS